VQEAFQKYQPGQIAFVLGLFPDHLFDLVSLLARGLGGAEVRRYSALGELDGRVTLMDAAQKLFGASKIPYFDIQRAAVTFSFGANFTETWLSPVAYAYSYEMMRRGYPGQRGYLVQFEPRRSQTAANADEWFPIRPGSEALLAQALACQVAKLTKTGPAAPVKVDLQAAAQACGVPVSEIERLARLFCEAPRRVAIPGWIPLGEPNGVAAAQAILLLNAQVDNLGKEGGIYLMPDLPLYPEIDGRPSTAAEMQGLAERLLAGQVKAVFIQGANPVYELPRAYRLDQALQQAELVVSFASFPDETSQLADYIFPSHTPLEAWGYQKVQTGSERMAASALQPVVVPLHDTKPAADVLLGAVQAGGGALAQALPFRDEVDFLQKSVAVLRDQGGGFTAPDAAGFWPLWLQHGGWWKAEPGLMAPVNLLPLEQVMDGTGALAEAGEAHVEGELFLLPFLYPAHGSQASHPTRQETSDLTTVIWNTWVEINPETARELGLHADDVVRITSPAGEVSVPVCLNPAIRPDTIAIPLEYTAYGRYAQGRGATVLDLLSALHNQAGNLAFMGARVQIAPTGRRRIMACHASKTGIYDGKHAA